MLRVAFGSVRSPCFTRSPPLATVAKHQRSGLLAGLQRRQQALLRDYASSAKPNIATNPRELSITLPNDTTASRISLPFVWLRDSCPCPLCVHSSTHQKLHRSSDVPLDITPVRSEWVVDGTSADGETRWVLEVEWDRPIYKHDTTSAGLEGHVRQGDEANARHVSRYSDAFLKLHTSMDALERFHHTKALEMVPWLHDDLAASDTLFIPYAEFQSSKKALLRSLLQLTCYGLVILTGVPNTIPTAEQEWELRKVANVFSHIRETFYGDLWDVKSLPNGKSRNIAYTDLDLDLHMDLLYFASPPRYQLLHCLRNRNVVGGDSLFVDALQAARTLFTEDREAFEVLCNTDVGFWYVNDGHHLEHKHKTIVVDDPSWPSSSTAPPRITAVNYSPPFQSPLPLHSTPPKFYPALQKFAALLRRREARWEYLLKEGDLAVFDNRRVLHARKAFTDLANAGDVGSAEPNRWLKGCYVEADAVLDRIRVLRTSLA